MSIFGRIAKWVEMTLERGCTVLCIAHGEGASAVVIVCYDKRVGRGVVSSYVRSKFATQRVDFRAPYEMGRINAGTAAMMHEARGDDVVLLRLPPHWVRRPSVCKVLFTLQREPRDDVKGGARQGRIGLLCENGGE